MALRILILCTANSCRSQMAHGFLQSFDNGLIVRSAGTLPAARVDEGAVKVMAQAGVDISSHTCHSVGEYVNEEWDYVISVCDRARENCPLFTGKVKYRLHFDFDDPSQAVGTPDFIESEYRRVRDEIRLKFFRLYVDEMMERPSCTCGANDFCRCE